MRLCDALNISHGRTSASALDDTLSGRAEDTSSATIDSEEEEEKEFEQPSLPIQQPHKSLEGGKAAQQSINTRRQKIHVV